MGFGIITIGFLALLLVDFGLGGVISGLTFSYGFGVLSKHDGRFRYGFYSSLIMIPCSGIKLMYLFDLVSESVNNIISVIFHLAWGSTVVFFLVGIIGITSENGADRFEKQAKALLYFNVIYFVAVLVEIFVPMGEQLYLLIIFKYVLIILDVLFAHKCFVHISTEEQTRRVLEELEEEDRKREDKKRKQQERLDKLREGKK